MPPKGQQQKSTSLGASELLSGLASVLLENAVSADEKLAH
jgi:hypothetical protein